MSSKSQKAISDQYEAGRSMNMERAARIHQYGAPEVLAVEPVEVTAPGPGEVRIRHKAIGLNFVEVYFRRGTFPVPAFLAILGNEAAGVVDAVGRDVRGVAVGDRVAYADGPSQKNPHRETRIQVLRLQV